MSGGQELIVLLMLLMPRCDERGYSWMISIVACYPTLKALRASRSGPPIARAFS